MVYIRIHHFFPLFQVGREHGGKNTLEMGMETSHS
jgi:hypothetical protein